MKYSGLPAGMWMLFKRSFRFNLSAILGLDEERAKAVTNAAKSRYKAIVAKLPEFEKGDRFKTNIVNCAMFSAFCLELPERPPLEEMTVYYRESMTTGAMKQFCKLGGRKKFSARDIAGMKKTAALHAADRNRYSWNMDFLPYPDGSGYEARFCKCGICTLMTELGIPEYIPSMCRLDYTMSELGGADDFVREYTLASGGPYCDCGYKKKGFSK